MQGDGFILRSDLDFNLISINSDDEGRSIVMDAEVQGLPFLFVNIYAPCKTQDQSCFFDKLNDNRRVHTKAQVGLK